MYKLQSLRHILKCLHLHNIFLNYIYITDLGFKCDGIFLYGFYITFSPKFLNMTFTD